MAPKLRQVVSHLKRRHDAEESGQIPADPNFPHQTAFIEDAAQFIDAQCSRRAGKTEGLARRFARTMKRFPGSTCIYLSLTRDSSREIMWPVLEALNEKYALGWRFVESKLLVIAPNGSRLRLWGADQKDFVKKLKGKKHPGIAIDEAQDFGSHLASLIDDILTPCLADYGEEGWLAVCGTPGPVPIGYWFSVSKERKFGYSHHEWTILDNPYMPDPAAFIARFQAKRGWPDDHPTLLREWRNQWVLDLESLWVRYRKETCDFEDLPTANWQYILGVDLGHEDSDALAILAYHDGAPDTYLLEEQVTAKQGITDLAGQINKLRARMVFTRMPCDEGALGKKIAEEIRRQHKIPLHAADKTRKQETVRFLNDAMRSGRFKARSNSRFAQDSYNIQIDRLKTTESKIALKGPHSDIIDAVIYAFKESPAYLYVNPPEQPKRGTEAYGRAQEEDMFKHALERAEYEKKMEKGPFDDPDDWK